MLVRMRLFDPDAPPPAAPPRVPGGGHDALVEAYLAHLAAVAGLAPTTCANHRLYLCHFLAWWRDARPGGDPLSARPADLADFLVHEADRGISPATRGAQAAMLRRFYAWLVLTGAITATPAAALGAPRTPPRDPELYRPEQVAAILEHTAGLTDWRGRQRHAIVSFLRYTGVRSRELRTLPLAELDLPAGRAKVVGKGSRPRAVLLPAPLVAVLDAYLAEIRPWLPDSDLLFVNPRAFGRHQPYRFEQAALGREVELAGIGADVPGRHYPHKWRHTYATELVRAGVDIHVVQRLLGHRSIRSTVGYTHLAVDDLRATVTAVWG